MMLVYFADEIAVKTFLNKSEVIYLFIASLRNVKLRWKIKMAYVTYPNRQTRHNAQLEKKITNENIHSM